VSLALAKGLESVDREVRSHRQARIVRTDLVSRGAVTTSKTPRTKYFKVQSYRLTTGLGVVSLFRYANEKFLSVSAANQGDDISDW
jgi:hypothetical protein